MGINGSLVQIAHYPGETIQTMAEFPAQAVLGKQGGCILSTLLGESFLDQYPFELGFHLFISNSHIRAPF